MYHIQIIKVGESNQSVTINAPVDTLIEAESVACRKCGHILGVTTGFLCYIGHGNYLMRVGQFCKGTVKIKEVKPKPDRGGKE